MKRMRGRGYRPGGGGGGQYRSAATQSQQPMNRNHVFDSVGPDLRLRGTAQQLFEKYLQLGREATGGGDRVMAEAYFQHAEHYFRIIGAMNQVHGQNQGQNGAQANGHNQQRRYQADDQQADQGEPEGEAETVRPVARDESESVAEAIEAELAAEAEPQPSNARS